MSYNIGVEASSGIHLTDNNFEYTMIAVSSLLNLQKVQYQM